MARAIASLIAWERLATPRPWQRNTVMLENTTMSTRWTRREMMRNTTLAGGRRVARHRSRCSSQADHPTRSSTLPGLGSAGAARQTSMRGQPKTSGAVRCRPTSEAEQDIREVSQGETNTIDFRKMLDENRQAGRQPVVIGTPRPFACAPSCHGHENGQPLLLREARSRIVSMKRAC